MKSENILDKNLKEVVSQLKEGDFVRVYNGSDYCDGIYKVEFSSRRGISLDEIPMGNHAIVGVSSVIPYEIITKIEKYSRELVYSSEQVGINEDGLHIRDLEDFEGGKKQ